jgi:hypothetical protein
MGGARLARPEPREGSAETGVREESSLGFAGEFSRGLLGEVANVVERRILGRVEPCSVCGRDPQ